MRKMISFFLALAMISLMMPTSCAADSEKSYLSLDVSEEQSILQKYSKEISCVEEKNNVLITAIDNSNLQLLKNAAIEHLDDPNYHFSELMTQLAVAFAQKRIEQESSSNSNIQVQAVSNYGIITGMHLLDVPTGTTSTITNSATFSVAAGSTVLGVELSTSFSEEFSYSVSGPPDGATISDDIRVTHRTAFAVLYGTVVTYNGMAYIETSTAEILDYTILASIGIPTYCSQASGAGTLYFSTPYDYHQRFGTNYVSVFL